MTKTNLTDTASSAGQDVLAYQEAYPALRWRGDSLDLLDQRLLPGKVTYLRLTTAREVARAIKEMAVRGAPAIGIAAAYGAVLAAREKLPPEVSSAGSLDLLECDLNELAAARPTAVNLFWALDRVRQELHKGGADVPRCLEALAVGIHREDIEANRRIGVLGAALMGKGISIYTHCNAGALATGGYGTALGVVRAAHAEKKLRQVYAGETRPWMQGSRLTSWELQQDGIPVTLATEGAAGSLMAQGLVDWVVVGSDRVARNGDVANKVGTYNLAVLARYHGVKFMVALPTTTIDLETANGAGIPIEQRDPNEVTHFSGAAVAPEGISAVNPAFDVTPAELVDAIVTERGVVENPDEARIVSLMT